MAAEEASPGPLLELRELTKSYGTPEHPVPVLHGVDLSVSTGSYTAIVGPSGSGKSTLLNIIGCLDRPTSGSYRLAGVAVHTLNDKRLSQLRNRKLGFIFQSFHLIPHLTVLENVELPLFYAGIARRERHPICNRLLERVGLGHRGGHRPTQLSGGERQRAAVARALVNDPELILADEPTGNLDTATSARIMGLIAELHEAGRTIVLITHDDDIAARAPRRITIRDGYIVDDTAPEDALAA